MPGMQTYKSSKKQDMEARITSLEKHVVDLDEEIRQLKQLQRLKDELSMMRTTIEDIEWAETLINSIGSSPLEDGF